MEEARKAIDRVGETLHNVRSALLNLGVGLAKVHEDLNSQLPAYVKAIADELTSEWHQATQQMSRLLGKRRALEQLIGAELKLENPTPLSVELDEQPFTVKRDLETAIEHTASYRRRRPPVAQSVDDAVYVSKRSFDGVTAGQYVVKATWGESELAERIQCGLVTRAADTQFHEGIDAAVRAGEKIAEERMVPVKARADAYLKDIARAEQEARAKELLRLYPGKTLQEAEQAHFEALRRRFPMESDPVKRSKLDDILHGAPQPMTLRTPKGSDNRFRPNRVEFGFFTADLLCAWTRLKHA